MTIRSSRGSRGLPQPKLTRGDAAFCATRAVRRLVEETSDFAGLSIADAVQLILAQLGNPDTFKDA